MRTGTRESLEPVCPFCKSSLDRPKSIELNAVEQVLGGRCSTCGAIYLADPTSKNVGEIMLQALSIAAKELSKDVSDLIAGEDYEDEILSYDWRTHRSSGPVKGFMDRYGRLYVIKIKKKPG